MLVFVLLFGALAAAAQPAPAGSLESLVTAAQKAQAAQKAHTSPVANTSALSQGTTGVGPQLAGVGTLALGFVLAVTRLTIRRRRPSAAKHRRGSSATKPATEQRNAKPPEAGPDHPAADGLK